MTKKQMKTWKNACAKAEKEKGYIPAEILMMPMFINMHYKGQININEFGDGLIITNKEEIDNELDTN